MFRPQAKLVFCLLLALSSGAQAVTELEEAAGLIQTKDFQAAQVMLERIVQADPRNAEALGLMGELQWATQNPRKAVEFADQAIQLDPNKASYYVLRGNALGNLAQHANVFRALSIASDARDSLD